MKAKTRTVRVPLHTAPRMVRVILHTYAPAKPTQECGLLREVVDAWPRLSRDQREAVLRLVDTYGLTRRRRAVAPERIL